MSGWYDNPQLEEILEERMSCFPRGLLGQLMQADIETSVRSTGPPRRTPPGGIRLFELAPSLEIFRKKKHVVAASIDYFSKFGIGKSFIPRY
jgi:hypothetical protein